MVIDGRHHAALVALGEAAGLPFPEVGPVEPAARRAASFVARSAVVAARTGVDLAIVGGGIVGLATAYRLLERHPDLRLAILEKEAELATHQSGHNSGVLHAGLYYTPGSLKARLCREGKAAMEAFATEHDIPFERCGKLVVALDASELERFEGLRERAEANGVPGLEVVGPERMRELEPHAAGHQGAVEPDDRHHRLPARRPRDRRRGPSPRRRRSTRREP